MYVSVYVCVYVGVTANSVHPGIVMTEVMRHYSFKIRCIFNFIGLFFFKVSTLLRFIAVTVRMISPLSCHQLCPGQICLAAVQEPPLVT